MQFKHRLDDLERRFEDLTAQMADPVLINDPAQYRKVAKSQRDMEEVVSKYRDWKSADRNLKKARAMLEETDPELRAMAQEEIAHLEPALERYEQELKVLLLPKDPNDDKNIVL